MAVVILAPVVNRRKAERMRRQFLVIAALFLLSPVAAKAQPAAVDIDGWERSQATTGTIYYRCRAATCDPSATVSYRPQQLTRLGTLEALRAQHEDINARMIQASQGRLRRVVTLDAGEADNSGAQVQTLLKAMEFTDGRREVMAVAMVLDEGPRAYSVVSTAPTEAAARANLSLVLPVILLAGRIAAKPTPR